MTQYNIMNFIRTGIAQSQIEQAGKQEKQPPQEFVLDKFQHILTTWSFMSFFPSQMLDKIPHLKDIDFIYSELDND